MDIAISLSLLAAIVILSVLGICLMYRLCGRCLDAQEAMRRDVHMITSQLMAARTLAETGNIHIPSKILDHSNAYDMRGQMPEVPTPEAEPADDEVNRSPDVVMGDEGVDGFGGPAQED